MTAEFEPPLSDGGAIALYTPGAICLNVCCVAAAGACECARGTARASSVAAASIQRTLIRMGWHSLCTKRPGGPDMASVASLREHLVEELNDLLNAEQQLVEALPMMAERATRKELQSAFRRHLAETKTHERRVTQALKALNEDASGTTCEAMQGLLEEGQELMSSAPPGALLDAMLITAAQKVEHY